MTRIIVLCGALLTLAGCTWMTKPPPPLSAGATPDEAAAREALVAQRNQQIEAEAQTAQTAANLIPGWGVLVAPLLMNLILSRKSS